MSKDKSFEVIEINDTWDNPLGQEGYILLPKGHKFFSFYIPKSVDKLFVLTTKGVLEIKRKKR